MIEVLKVPFFSRSEYVPAFFFSPVTAKTEYFHDRCSVSAWKILFPFISLNYRDIL